MNATTTGLRAGLFLGAAGSMGGFGPFLITLVVGIVGLLVGLAIDGRLDVASMPTPLAEPDECRRLYIHPAVHNKIPKYAADGVPGRLLSERIDGVVVRACPADLDQRMR